MNYEQHPIQIQIRKVIYYKLSLANKYTTITIKFFNTCLSPMIYKHYIIVYNFSNIRALEQQQHIISQYS